MREIVESAVDTGDHQVRTILCGGGQQVAVIRVSGYVNARALAELENEAHVIQIRGIRGEREGAVDGHIAELQLASGPCRDDPPTLDALLLKHRATGVRANELRGVPMAQALDGCRV